MNRYLIGTDVLGTSSAPIVGIENRPSPWRTALIATGVIAALVVGCSLFSRGMSTR